MKIVFATRILTASLAALLALCSCVRPSTSEVQPHIERCADLPVGHTSAAAFVVGGQLYVFGGRTATQSATNDLYCYDPVADTWAQLPAPPLRARVKAAATVVDGKA